MSEPNVIDMNRCIHGVFHDAETFTTEQESLARDVIVDGPPNNRNVVLKLAGGAKWVPDTNEIRRDGVSVRIKLPMQECHWSGDGNTRAP